MSLSPVPGRVVDITADELRSFQSTHRESEYTLVDVRQPEEYQGGHIPGAKLVPLSDFEQRAGDVLALQEQRVIFYCRSGGRSTRAAGFAVAGLGLTQVFNLRGGFLAWSGAQVDDLPPLRALDLQGGVADLLHQALDLEKGTHRLYEALVPAFAGTDLEGLIDELVRAEVAHGQVVYDTLARIGARPSEEFAALFASLPGQLVESGQSFAEVVGIANARGQDGRAALLELALELELRALDLYRALAERTEDVAAREVLLDLAQQEKRHAEGIFKRLGGK